VVRQAQPSERSKVAETVAAAFADDPAWAFMLGEDYARLAVYFAAALFDVRIGTDTVWVSDDLAAVAMWDPPADGDRPAERVQSIWARYRALAGEDVMGRLSSYNAAVAAAAPPEAYWYLGTLATHPRRRREGLASAVLEPIVAEADRLGLACCLETSTEANRRFYERRGFTEATPIALSGGPPTWWLRRAPLAATA
jgi:GNAT superfamily N-acetyltransferase